MFMQGSVVHLVILANHNSIIQKALRWSDGGSRDPGSLLLFAECWPQPPLSLSTPKNLYLLHDAWKHTVFSYNFTWPLTPSAQMQYDLAATIHFGLWSRFNEFLLCCMCMSLGLALSVDPSHHQWVLKMHHLAIQNEHVQPLQDRS